MDGCEQWPLYFYGVVKARWGFAKFGVIIDNIDPADESDTGIDDGKFAMHATQSVASEFEGEDFLAVYQYPNTGCKQIL